MIRVAETGSAPAERAGGRRQVMRAVRFDRYGDVDVLKVVEVERPKPGAGELLVRVKAAGINPGEAAIRKGLVHAIWPATFPSGEGSDLAGIVEEVGAEVKEYAAGDEVVGFTNRRASHAEYVVVKASRYREAPRECAVGGGRCAVRRRHHCIRGRPRRRTDGR